MITLDRLRYFVEVARLEHVGQAAQLLAVSPSVVSAAIKELELEFDCQLFERVSKRLKLSAKGELLLEKAQGLLEDTRQLYSDLSSESTTLKGHYKLAASHILMQEFLIPAFLELKKSNPQLTVEFQALDTGMAVSRVLAGELDAALVFRASYYHDLDEAILNEGQFKIAVKKNHPILKVPAKKRVEELNLLPAITFRTSFGPNFWENHPSFKVAGIVPDHTFFYEDTQTALQLLSKTNGWAFMPEMVLKRYKQLAEVKLSFEMNAPVNISLIRNKNKPTNQFIEKLKGILWTSLKP